MQPFYNFLNNFLVILSEATIICGRPEQSRRPRWQGFAIPFLLLLSCSGDPSADALHRTADSLIAAGRPDSALLLLNVPDSAGPENYSLSTNHYSPSQRMRHELLRARAMNKAFVDLSAREDSLSPDSVMQQVADYYDRHGTPNERMEAHYLLGCTYRDMGEAPHAVDCYLDAAACADTTATDCDFYMLASIYAQMATLYHQQLLLSYEIDAHRKAHHYHLLAKDTLHALYEQKMIAGAYTLGNKRDSAEQIIKDVIRQYRKTGYEQGAIQTSVMLMHLYVDLPERQQELKQLIDCYDQKSQMFDEHHELPPSARQYFYYKGKFFEYAGKLDSAEFYYHKVYRPGMSAIEKIPLFRGLFCVFTKKEYSDSIAKYAQLYCDVNDSSIHLKDQAITAQMAASYNYGHYQKEAKISVQKAHRMQLLAIVLGTVFLLVTTSSIYGIRVNRKRQQKKRMMLEEAHKEREAQLQEAHRQELEKQKNLSRQKEGELKRIEEIYHKVINTIQQELNSAKSDSQSIRENYAKARRTIDEINAHYEKDRAALKEEIRELKNRIEELTKRVVFTDNKEKARLLQDADITMRLKSKANSPKEPITEEELKSLEDAYSQFFPVLLQEVKQSKGMNNFDQQVALLVALGFKPGEIQCLTGRSPSQITNSKAKANKTLFGDRSASSLSNNMIVRYGL